MPRDADGNHTDQLCRVQLNVTPGTHWSDGAQYYIRSLETDTVLAICADKVVAERIEYLLNTYTFLDPMMLDK